MTTVDASRGEPLTARQREVLVLAADGLSNAEIAAQLWLNVNTVRTHLHVAYAKLGANSRAKAVAVAIRTGVI